MIKSFIDFVFQATDGLIYPSFVAAITALLTYKASYRLQEKTQRTDNKVRTIDLLDNLIFGYEKLVSILENLKVDVEKLRYFSITNIEVALSIIGSLRNNLYNINLLPDHKLRRQIIEIIDEANSLALDMNGIERYLLNQSNEVQLKEDSLQKELMQIKLHLLGLGFYIDVKDNYKPKPIEKAKKGKKIDFKISAIEDILNDLVKDINSGEDKLKSLNTDYEKRRTFLTVRILDIQTKIRELGVTLNELKNNLPKK